MRAKSKHASIVTKPTKPAEQIGKEKNTRKKNASHEKREILLIQSVIGTQNFLICSHAITYFLRFHKINNTVSVKKRKLTIYPLVSIHEQSQMM